MIDRTSIPLPRSFPFIGRRSFMQIGGLGIGGLGLADILQADDRDKDVRKRHKAIIMVLLPGGPSHIDMFDLKPLAPEEVRGEFLPIKTNVEGVEISELMPKLARRAHRYSLLRTVVGSRNDHNVHQCVTGWESHPTQPASKEIPGYPPGGWPSIGAVLSKVHGPAVPGIPPAVDLTPVYFDARFVTSADPCQAGYLGAAHSGFEIHAVDRANIQLNGIKSERLSDRRVLLKEFDRFRKRTEQAGFVDELTEYQKQAFALLTSSRLARALDLSNEAQGVRTRYTLDALNAKHGGNAHLDQFLLARRVVEAGARCVTLCFSRYPFGRFSQGDYNWDWHKDNFGEARATLPHLDTGIAGLIDDLQERGLLDDVAVVVWGEFGRTPKINKNAGRDHWPDTSSALIAGGGFKAGQVIGETSAFGERPIKRPVHFREVFATLYQSMGIDIRTTQFTDLAGRPQYLVDDREPISELI